MSMVPGWICELTTQLPIAPVVDTGCSVELSNDVVPPVGVQLTPLGRIIDCPFASVSVNDTVCCVPETTVWDAGVIAGLTTVTVRGALCAPVLGSLIEIVVDGPPGLFPAVTVKLGG